MARSENVMYVHWRPEFLVTVSSSISLFLGCQNSLIKYDTSLAYKSKCLSGLEDFAIVCHFAVLILQLSVEISFLAKTKMKVIFQTPYPRQKGTRWNKTHIINRKGSI